MRRMTECFLLRNSPEREVLLGLKKRGFGAGKLVGIGGKLEPGETIAAAAIREVEEEIGVKIALDDLRYLGVVTFVFPSQPDWDQEVSIFTAERWFGEPVESNEMRPAWFKLTALPYASMWQDAPHWMPKILSGTEIQARIIFENDQETVKEVDIKPLRTLRLRR